MEELLAAISDLVSNTPPDRIVQLADAIHGLPGSTSSANLSAWVLSPSAKTRLDRLTASWDKSGVPSGKLAGMLLGASYAYRQAKSESETELVWTGPSSELIATRKTEQALLQVINAAREKLFLTSYVAYPIFNIFRGDSRG